MPLRHRERRTHPRVPVSRSVLYRSHIYPRPRVAFTWDISLEGVKIDDVSSLYCREGLDLWLSLEPRVIECKGRVVHVERVGDRFCAGIHFEAMAEEDRIVLDRYLADLVKTYGEP